MLSTFIIAVLATSSITLVVQYPNEVLIGQPFNITFFLGTSVINSTNFQYLTQGTQIENVSGHLAYKGFGGYYALFKVNLSSANELEISFVGTIVGPFLFRPGIVLYSYNLSLGNADEQRGILGVLFSWDGNIYVQKLQGVWILGKSDLPSFYSGNYTVILRNENSSVYVYKIIVNSHATTVNYSTGVPWNSIGYVGIRLDVDTISPYFFIVKSDSYITTASPSKYVVYVNGKEYASGYSAEGNITIRTFTTTIVNITFPELKLYKIVVISPERGNVKENFPTIQVILLSVAGGVIAFSIWREIKRK